MTKKIAIIGGGAAGSGALWALNQIHDVTLFEADSYLGGHAYTHEIDVNGQQVAIDMGVEYFHERLSPNLCALFEHFNIESYVAPLSFRAIDGKKPESGFWSNQQFNGELKKQLDDEMNRFHLHMLDVMQNPNTSYKGMSMQDFLNTHDYSDAFKYQALLPLMTTFSGCKAPSLSYSLMYFALAFNMNLLSFYTPCHWRKTKGGIRSYLKKIHELYDANIKLNMPVVAVEKNQSNICVTLADKSQYYFDEVIFACQAYIAHKLIKNGKKEQYKRLESFQYVDVESILHTDSSVVPHAYSADEYFQFELIANPSESFSGSLTRVNRNLYPYHAMNESFYVSFDNRNKIDASKILTIKQWKLPMLRPVDMLHKSQVRHIQGLDNMWFCGTDYTLTGHEGALVSGFVIAHRLGAPYHFANNWLAKAQFDVIKHFMGVFFTREKIAEKVMGVLMNSAKKLNLYQKFSGRLIKEILF